MERYTLRMCTRTVVCGLALLGLGGAARAADVTVQPAADSSFVVTDNAASPLFTVQESEEVLLPGLPTAAVQAKALCSSPAGILGRCASSSGGGARLIDNGDGTVTGTKTGLMWEKKTSDGSVHDVGKTFPPPLSSAGMTVTLALGGIDTRDQASCRTFARGKLATCR